MRRIALTLTIALLTLCCAYSNTTPTLPALEPSSILEGLNGFVLQSVDSVGKDTAKKVPSTPRQPKKDTSLDRDKQFRLFESFVDESPTLNAKFDSIQNNIQVIQTSLDSINGHLMKQGETTKEFLKGYNKNKLLVCLALIALAVLLIVNVLYFLLRFRGLRGEIVAVVTSSDRIKRWLKNNSEKPSVDLVQKSNDGEIRSLQNENRDLKKRVTQLEDLVREWGKKSESIVLNQTPVSPKPAESPKRLFADSILNEVFLRVRQQENEDTLYVLKLKSETRATFTLYERAYNRVIANTSFLEGCEKQVVGNNSVEIIREGEAEKGVDGKWKVVTPLKIEIR